MAEQPEAVEQDLIYLKPKLTIAQQISHLKDKGIKFEKCGEDEAASFLAEQCDFYEATSYRKLFTKRQGGERDGEYANLDFAQLKVLAALDETLREVLFPMTRHIEHSWKVSLKRSVSEREDEDGYEIVSDYLSSLSAKDRNYRTSELKRSSLNPYTRGIYKKYAEHMPTWAFLELTSFGTLTDFVRFCGERWDDKTLTRTHYDLKKVKSVRNCTAHGSCIINSFAEGENSKHTTSVDTLSAVAASGLSKTTRKKWMRNAATQEIAVTLVRYSRDVPEGHSKDRAEKWLRGFFDEVKEANALLPQAGPDATAAAALHFIESLTRSLELIK